MSGLENVGVFIGEKSGSEIAGGFEECLGYRMLGYL